MVDFTGQTVLITGAGRGLGLAYARCLGRLGARVWLQDTGADRDGDGEDPAVAWAAAEALRGEGLDVEPVAGRLDHRDHCRALVERVLASDGRLDAVIHNAGWVAYQPVEAITEEAFDRIMAVAAKAPLWLAQAAWPKMKAAGGGRLVFTTSCRALYPQYVQQGLAAYAAARMAVVGLVNVLAEEGRAHGIRVNAVSPVAKTRMWGLEGEPDELHPAQVAPGVAFLASSDCPEGGWILRAANGQFHATRAVEATGVDYPRDLCAVPAAGVEKIAAAWPRIAVPAVESR
tara:strand:+ start:8383 stop:9246 length:864 start_codon:yes stop_codon:yes gene_type:complete